MEHDTPVPPASLTGLGSAEGVGGGAAEPHSAFLPGTQKGSGPGSPGLALACSPRVGWAVTLVSEPAT